MIKKYFLSTGLLLMVCSCASPIAVSNTDIPSKNKPVNAIADRCLVTQPKDVHLWINAMPGPKTGKQSPLRAAFTVTAPTPGYQFALKVNRVMESSPEQVVLDLVVTRPAGMVIQVVTETKVNIELADFPGSEGSAVHVNCGGAPFFKVDRVMAVH